MSVRVVMVVLDAETLLAVEHQEVHAERVQRGDEHARHHREVRETRNPSRCDSCTASMIESFE